MKKIQFLFALFVTASIEAQTPQVVINEFVPKGTEWVELYNTTSIAVDLTGWKLTSSIDGDSFEISTGTISGNSHFLCNGFSLMDNDGDSLFLVKPGDTIVDFVAFGDAGSAPVSPMNYSVSRITDGYWTGNIGHDFNMDLTPTQNAPNDAKPAPLNGFLVINEIDPYPTGGNDSIELVNISFTDTVNTAGWMLSDGDEIDTIHTHIVPPRSFLVIDESEFGFDFASQDVCYLFSSDTSRLEQLGWSGEYNDFSLQRIPNGSGPRDGFNWISSGGGTTLFDTTATWGSPNGFMSIEVTYPNGGETLYAGDTLEVTWIGTAVAYDVYISYDGGVSWDTIADSATSSPLFELPRHISSNCLVCVFSDEDYFFFDNSDSVFTILDTLPLGDTIEVYYDSSAATGYYYWGGVGEGSAMRLTAPAQRGPFRLIGAKYYLQDATTGSNIFDCKVFNWAGTEPGMEEFTQNVTFPLLGSPQWYTVDVSAQYLNVDAGEDFVVGIFYDGVNQPTWGFYAQTNNRAWDYDGSSWSQWSSEIYCIRALLADLNGVVEEIGNDVSIEKPSVRFSDALFGGGSYISYAVPSYGRVVIQLFDVTGREVRTILDRQEQPGLRHIPFDGRDGRGFLLSKGVYFVRLQSSDGSSSCKITVVE
ncbi:lamin tail domain-containing protein [candidate division WOR-3 bacterium]|nr:lamin tail domain-containing protein [candidate division WOR-3 bacterium]